MAKNQEPEPPSWIQVMGSNHWSGLLDPLNLTLRNLILRAGDLCQATYDSFNSDPNSKYCGSCRYGKHHFFHKVAFPSPSLYQISSYLYATARIPVPGAFLLHSLSREAWSRESNWIGYVAVSSDTATRMSGRREIFIAWRGTIRDLEWLDVLEPNLDSIQPLLPANITDGSAKVMNGWFTIYTSDDPKSPFTKTSARTQLLTKVKELVELYKDEELSLTTVGHSLGACLAVLSAFDIVVNGLSRVGGKEEFPVTAFVFGCPTVGNKAFKERLEKLPNLRVLHVRNEIDLIPRYPGRLLGYERTGVELVVDTRKSPYLKESKNPSDWHNLQAILHVVAGWQGKGKGFELQVKRSVALVNKSCEFLKDECLVPGSWWVEKNKGMVVGEDGEWFLSPPAEDDVPVPES